MRLPLLVVSLGSCLVACGGKASAPATTPVANAAPSAEPTEAAAPADDPAALCAKRASEFGPLQLTADQATRRYGQQAAKFTDALTTKDKPIEVCGIPEQQDWLLKVTCADGSKAYTSRGQIPGSRRGNVGPGGRCDSIIDLYVAKCPEAEYEVHMDMYMCPDGQSFM